MKYEESCHCGRVALLSPEGAASTYTFNKHAIKHHFCPVCGVHPYGEGMDPGGNQVAASNLRCVEGIDLSGIPVHEFDGRAMEARWGAWAR
jgi:hypothetical protein